MGKLGIINDDNKANKNKINLVIPFKHFSNFWRLLKMPLINYEIELILTWPKNCVILSNARRNTIAATEVSAANVADVKPAVNLSATSAPFKITDTKLYVPIVTLSTEDDNKLLEQLKTRFKKTIKWYKYRSEVSNQTKNNNLNYLIDPTFTKVNRLFALLLKNENDRTSFSKYYTLNIEMY